MTKILGLSFGYHDSAAALVVDGEIVAADQEERFSRRKHDPGFPDRAIAFCLQQGSICAAELDRVVYYEDPMLKLDRIVRMTDVGQTAERDTMRRIMRNWMDHDKIDPLMLIAKNLDIPSDKISHVRHHEAHAASAFYCSPFDEATIVTIDGVGEYETMTVSHGQRTKIEKLSHVDFPHSIGLFYSAFTAYLGFEVNDAEYKVMGMAAFGSPRYVDDIQVMIDLMDDGLFRIADRVLNAAKPNLPIFGDRLVQEFGPPREPESLFDPSDNAAPEVKALSSKYADIAASLQVVLEQSVMKIVEAACVKTQCRHVCMAGGVALNSVANARIEKELGVELFVQPAAGDAGGALGAAMIGALVDSTDRVPSVQFNPYIGESFTDTQIEDEMRRRGFSRLERLSDTALIDKVADALYRGQVVGWFQGRGEWGPRALGARSILADPTSLDMQERVNVKIKYREPFRPFAPSVLAENARDYFDIPEHVNASSPHTYMLSVVGVRDHARGTLPAITHVDGSARVQLVHQSLSPKYHQLIRAFADKSGVPVLLNTSLNLRGQPIAGSPWDAAEIFSYSGIDLLAIENYVFEKCDVEWE